MIDNDNIHQRRSIRLPGYDYSQLGAYFITICTQDRKCLFGNIVDGKMTSNDAGTIIQTVWRELPIHYNGTEIDEFVVMPNHIHGIVIVGATPRIGQAQEGGQPQGVAPTENITGNTEPLSLPDVVHRFKTMTTKRYADGVKQYGWPPFPGRLWQRNYWEHIVRNEIELNKIREYIRNNSTQWDHDRLNSWAYVGAGPRACPNGVKESHAYYGEKSWMM